MCARLTQVFGPAVEAGRRRAPSGRAPRSRSPGQAREQPLPVWAPSRLCDLLLGPGLLGWGLLRGWPADRVREILWGRGHGIDLLSVWAQSIF